MDSKEKVFTELEAELDQIFTEMEIDAFGYHRGAACLRELVLVAVRYPNNWQKGHFNAFARRYNLTRERIRVMLWRTSAERWNRNCRGILNEHFGHPIELKFKIISKPNSEEFVTLLADNLRAKYQIQPEEGEYKWSEDPLPDDFAEDEGVIIDDDEFFI